MSVISFPNPSWPDKISLQKEPRNSSDSTLTGKELAVFLESTLHRISSGRTVIWTLLPTEMFAVLQ